MTQRGQHLRWYRGTAAERGGYDTDALVAPALWFETDTGDVYQWDGSAWQSQSGLSLADLSDYARGSFIRGGVEGWEAYAAETDGQILVGDGTDIASVPISNDITLANSGAVDVVSLSLPDTDDSHDLDVVWNEDATGNRVLNLDLNDGDRALTLEGDLTVESASLLNQDLTSDASPTFANVYVPDGGFVGVSGDLGWTFGAAGSELEANENIAQADGKYIATDEIRARDGDGLGLYDDAGDGLFVKDGGNVGIKMSDPVTPLEIPGNTSNSSAKFGAYELQTFSTNNCWLANNAYYNGGFKAREDGYATLLYFIDGEIQIRTTESSQTGGDSISAPLDVTAKFLRSGGLVVGNDVSASVNSLSGANFAVTEDGDVVIGDTDADARFHVSEKDAVTDAVTYVQRLTHESSGTPASGFGVGLEFELESTTRNRVVGGITWEWDTATDASRSVIGKLYAEDHAASREVIAWGASGSAATLGFYATTPITQPNVTGVRDDPEGALKELLIALDDLGIISDGTLCC